MKSRRILALMVWLVLVGCGEQATIGSDDKTNEIESCQYVAAWNNKYESEIFACSELAEQHQSIELIVNDNIIDQFPNLTIKKNDDKKLSLAWLDCNVIYEFQEITIMRMNDFKVWESSMVDGIHPIIWQEFGDFVLVGTPWDILKGEGFPSSGLNEKNNETLDDYRTFLDEFLDSSSNSINLFSEIYLIGNKISNHARMKDIRVQTIQYMK